MKRTFTLVPDNSGSTDTNICVAELSEKVRAGKTIGLAYIEIERGRKYRVKLCGEALRSPAFTRGCVGALIDKLGRMQRGEEE